MLKIMRRKEVLQAVGASNATLWRWEKDGFFPARRQLSPGGSVGWLSSEVEEWIKNRPVVNGH